MAKKFQISLIIILFLSLWVPAFAEDSGNSSNNEFGVNIKNKEEKFINGFSGGVSNRIPPPNPVEPPSSDIGSAVQILHFQERKDPNDRRARLLVNGGPQTGSYCLTEGDQLGTMALVPPDWGDGLDTPYNTSGGLRGCVPLTPEELEAAGFETAEVDGQTVLRVTQVVLSVEDFNTFPVTPAQAHQERAPHTLKNYNTNFWADPNPQEFTRTIAGQEVALRATPVSYTFAYGDGTTLGPVSYPGYQLGEDIWDQATDTSHKYTEPGDYEFTITTSYRGEYSVSGGPWQVIDGTVERTTDPQLVRVWRVKAGLVADDCEQNPQAWGCPGT